MAIDWITGVACLTVSGWTGFNVVRALTGRGGIPALAGGWLLGMAELSLGVFWIYLLGGAIGGALPWLQLALLGGSLALRYGLRNRWTADSGATEPFGNFAGAWLLRLLLAVLSVSVLLAAVTSPALRFDELHNWGFKAVSAATENRPFQGYWPFMLFPNHVPFAAAGMMSYMQEPLETAAHLIPFLCFLALLGCFHFAVVQLTGKAYWGLAMTSLLAVSVPELMEQGDRLTCDLPLAAQLAGAVAFSLLWLRQGGRGALILSGFTAGLCAWTKTEGLLLTAGVGGGLALAALLAADRRKTWFRAALIWALAAGLVIGPWYLFLQAKGVGMESSGHLGAFDGARLPVVLAGLGAMLRYKFAAPALATVVFLAVGLFKADRAIFTFLLATLTAGFLHIALPLLMLPGDAFGGWQDFMKHGMERYCLHIAPVMLLSVAAATRKAGSSPLDGVFRLLVCGPVR